MKRKRLKVSGRFSQIVLGLLLTLGFSSVQAHTFSFGFGFNYGSYESDLVSRLADDELLTLGYGAAPASLTNKIPFNINSIGASTDFPLRFSFTYQWKPFEFSVGQSIERGNVTTLGYDIFEIPPVGFNTVGTGGQNVSHHSHNQNQTYLGFGYELHPEWKLFSRIATVEREQSFTGPNGLSRAGKSGTVDITFAENGQIRHSMESSGMVWTLGASYGFAKNWKVILEYDLLNHVSGSMNQSSVRSSLTTRTLGSTIGSTSDFSLEVASSSYEQDTLRFRLGLEREVGRSVRLGMAYGREVATTRYPNYFTLFEVNRFEGATIPSTYDLLSDYYTFNKKETSVNHYASFSLDIDIHFGRQ